MAGTDPSRLIPGFVPSPATASTGLTSPVIPPAFYDALKPPPTTPQGQVFVPGGTPNPGATARESTRIVGGEAPNQIAGPSFATPQTSAMLGVRGLGDAPSAVSGILAQPDPAFDAFWTRMVPGESGGKNVPNERYDLGHTASGTAQITDTNWNAVAPRLGIDIKQYPTAMSAPPDYQKAVAKLMFRMDRTAPWDTAHGGALPVGGTYPGGSYPEQIRAGYDQKAANATAGLREAIKQINAGEADLGKVMERIRKAQDRADEAQDAAQKALREQPHAPVIDGVKHVTGFATIVGLLGGLFTKAPMLASTNAAAAALEAYNAGDLRAFHMQHDLWKENTDYLFKVADANEKRVRDIMEEEKLPIEERRARVEALLRALGLQQIADQARIDGPKTVQDWLDKQEDLRLRREEVLRRLDQWVPVHDKKTGEYYEVNLRDGTIKHYPPNAEPASAATRARPELTPSQTIELNRRMSSWIEGFPATHDGREPTQNDIDEETYQQSLKLKGETAQVLHPSRAVTKDSDLNAEIAARNKAYDDDPKQDHSPQATHDAHWQNWKDVQREATIAKHVPTTSSEQASAKAGRIAFLDEQYRNDPTKDQSPEARQQANWAHTVQVDRELAVARRGGDDGKGLPEGWDETTVKWWADTLTKGGALPPGFARSKNAGNAVAAIMKEMGATGDPGAFIENKSVVHADQGSLNSMTKMADSAVSFEKVANANLELALRLAPNAIPSELGPWFNRWIEEGNTLLGDPAVPAYVAAMITAANEYAKVMSGSTGTAASTVDSRREAVTLFSPYLSLTQIRAVAKVAQQDMKNRENTLYYQIDQIRSRLHAAGSPQPTEQRMNPGGGDGGGRPAGAPSDARKAPDGRWYSPDPDRPGKYRDWGPSP